MKKKNEILIITEFFPRSDKGEARGGVELRSWELAKRLSKNNDIKILTSLEAGLDKKSLYGSLKIIRCGLRRKYVQHGDILKRFYLMISIFMNILKIKPDIIDAQSMIAYLPSYLAAKILRIPKIITVHDVWIGKWKKLFGNIGIIGQFYEKVYLKLKWDLFISVSNFTKGNLISNGIDKNKIKVLPCGINNLFLENVKVKKYEQITITCISRLVKYKNVQDLIKSINIIKDKYPNIKCRVVGSGPYKNELLKLVNKLGLENYIIFDGFVKEYIDVIKILKKSHVFCLPSSIEGFGIVNLEAMACAIPIVASDIKPIKEVTENGRGAVLFKLGDIEEISQKITLLLENNDLYQKMQQNGKIIARKYDWDKITLSASEFYNNL